MTHNSDFEGSQQLPDILNHDSLTIGSQFKIKSISWRQFKSKYVGPSFRRFPEILWPILMIVRNLKFYNFPRALTWKFAEDESATNNIVSFLDSDEFASAYLQLRCASGSVVDPGLHWRLHQICWAMSHCLELGGVFVECGTGRGLMMSGGLRSIPDWNARGLRLYLFDTFEPFGLDPISGINDQKLGVRETYAKSIEDVRETFAEWANVQLVQGFLPETLSALAGQRIAFLHIDLNHPIAEVATLRYLWLMLLPNAIVVLDDYAQVKSQNDAMNELAVELGVKIMTTQSGQGILIKPAAVSG